MKKQSIKNIKLLINYLLIGSIILQLLGVLVISNVSSLNYGLSVDNSGLLHNSRLKLAFGYPWSPVPNVSERVGELEDEAYTFTGVNTTVYTNGLHYDDVETAVVIDFGFSKEEWLALEQDPIIHMDVLGLLTYNNRNGTIVFLSSINDSRADFYLPPSNASYVGHGFAVASMIGAICSDANILLVHLNYTGDYGFELTSSYDMGELFRWLYLNKDAFSISIIVLSGGTTADFAPENSRARYYMQKLKGSGIPLIVATGNSNTENNVYLGREAKYPQVYPEWWAIGSIDHEDRNDPLKDSLKYSRSGEAPEIDWGSSWFSNTVDDDTGVKWLMPGNGVPALSNAYYNSSLALYTGTWEYHRGTSFSAPYLAAVILWIISRYHDGYGDTVDPSISRIEQILLLASSRDTYDQKMGWGYIDVVTALQLAYSYGQQDGDDNDGGGGGAPPGGGGFI